VIEDAGVLVLEDGSEFPGFLFGAPITPESYLRDRGYGETVFNTSLTGYQEILTDPSYFGQIVCMTASHIGNTGVNIDDPESGQPWCAGFIVHETSENPSNWRSSGSFDAYLKEHGIPGLTGVDTRALTLRLRSSGVIRGVILASKDRAQAQSLLQQLPPFEGRDLIGEVTTRESYIWRDRKSGFAGLAGATKKPYRVVALDYGVKWNLLQSLSHFGCEIEVMPATASAQEILEKKPDGIFLSNGPGDPTAAPYAAKTVKELVGKVPLFGVCMGHQILGLALGAKTYKLKFGHRGGNQPVFAKESGRVEISSHNHGYALDGISLPSTLEVTHTNLNDKTVEGIRVKGKAAFSVQYHPEACPGPHDSQALFEEFVKSMEQARTQKNVVS